MIFYHGGEVGADILKETVDFKIANLPKADLDQYGVVYKLIHVDVL